MQLLRFHLVEDESCEREIKQELEKKLDRMVMRDLYGKFKTAPTEEEREPARKEYLDLLMSGRLNSYLAGIEEQAQERFEIIVEQMKQAQGITEQLKADDTWEWVGRMNNIQVCAREIVNKEIIYQ